MPNPPPILTTDRDALYYPYIHIQDANWLKAALLCFPHVRRMVPAGFSLRDSDAIKPFATLEVDGKPLLIDEQTHSDEIEHAFNDFTESLHSRREYVARKFSARQAQPFYGDSFRIHKWKLTHDLVGYLRRNELAWPTTDSDPRDPVWYALHPTLGEALMSVLAIATARKWGMDIVTSDPQMHRALASQQLDLVFNDLIEKPVDVKPPPLEEVTDELALVFMNTAFDLSKLTPQQIVDLKKDGDHLRAFKDELASIAARVSQIPNPQDRRKELEGYAKEIVKKWNGHRRKIRKSAGNALHDAFKQDIKLADIGVLTTMGGHLAWLGGPIGLGIGIALFTSYKIWGTFKEEIAGPYQYLSNIQRAGGKLEPVATTAILKRPR